MNSNRNNNNNNNMNWTSMNSMTTSTITILNDNKQDNHQIFSCINCNEHLFDSSSMIQRQIEIDDNKFGCIVDCLYNNDDITMGPKICKNFLNGMFKVNQILAYNNLKVCCL